MFSNHYSLYTMRLIQQELLLQMVPVIGPRYECLDCPKPFGFNLCETCPQSRFNLVGDVNQEHNTEHNMVKRRVALGLNIVMVDITMQMAHNLEHKNPYSCVFEPSCLMQGPLQCL